MARTSGWSRRLFVLAFALPQDALILLDPEIAAHGRSGGAQTAWIHRGEWESLLDRAIPLDTGDRPLRPTGFAHLRASLEEAGQGSLKLMVFPVGRASTGGEVGLSIADGVHWLESADPSLPYLSLDRLGSRPIVVLPSSGQDLVMRLPERDTLPQGWVPVWLLSGGSLPAELECALLPEGWESLADAELAKALSETPADPVPVLPKYLLRRITTDLRGFSRGQGKHDLEEHAAAYSQRGEPSLRLAFEYLRDEQPDRALSLLRKPDALPMPDALLAWIEGAQGRSLLIADRNGVVEAFAYSDVDRGSMERTVRIAAEAFAALARTHLAEEPETVLALIGDHEPAFLPLGWLTVVLLPAQEVPGIVSASTLANRILAPLAANADPEVVRQLAAYAAALATQDPGGPAQWPGIIRAGWNTDEEAGELRDVAAAALRADHVLNVHGPAAFGHGTNECPDGPEDLLEPLGPGELRLQHLGHACFRLTAQDGTTLLVDPFSDPGWLRVRFPWTRADFFAATHGHSDHDAVEEVRGRPHQVPFTFAADTPPIQEADAGPFHLTAYRTAHDPRYGSLVNLVLQIDVGDLRIVHLGDVDAPLTEELVRGLGDVDLLLAPIDDTTHVLSGSELAAMVEVLHPRVLVPMHYRTPGLGELEPPLEGIDHWLTGRERVRLLDRDYLLIAPQDLPESTGTWVFDLSLWPMGRLERAGR